MRMRLGRGLVLVGLVVGAGAALTFGVGAGMVDTDRRGLLRTQRARPIVSFPEESTTFGAQG